MNDFDAYKKMKTELSLSWLEGERISEVLIKIIELTKTNSKYPRVCDPKASLIATIGIKNTTPPEAYFEGNPIGFPNRAFVLARYPSSSWPATIEAFRERVITAKFKRKMPAKVRTHGRFVIEGLTRVRILRSISRIRWKRIASDPTVDLEPIKNCCVAYSMVVLKGPIPPIDRRSTSAGIIQFSARFVPIPLLRHFGPPPARGGSVLR